MLEEWEKYLLKKVDLRDLQTCYKKKPKDPKGFRVLDGIVPITLAPYAQASSSITKQEHDALFSAASELKDQAKKDCVIGEDPQSHNGSRKGGKGKGRSKKGPEEGSKK